MGTQQRRDRQRSELRSLIMDTARRLFAAEGYSAVSMRRIADAIEYSPTAIYVHFQDKQSLMRELCAEDFARLASEFMQLAQVRDPIDRIRQAGRLYIRFAVEHPNHYKLMFMTELEPDPQRGPQNDQMHNRSPEEDAYAFLLHSVKQAMDAGRFRPELTDPQLVAQTFWAMVHGVASLHVVKGHDPWIGWASLQARTDCALNAALSGLVVGKKNWFGCPMPGLRARRTMATGKAAQ